MVILYEPWMLAAMEEAGYMDTREGLVNRVALYIKQEEIALDDEDAFLRACWACDVNPCFFSEDDWAQLRRKLR